MEKYKIIALTPLSPPSQDSFSPPCQGTIDSLDNKQASVTDCLQLDSDKTDQ